MRWMVVALWVAWVGAAVAGAAQTPASRTEPLPDMNAIAKALGVTCGHCHVPRDFTSDANPKKVIARQMLAMTREINARVEAATGKPTGTSVAVQCATCHRGQPVPRSLSETLVATLGEKGDTAMAEQYRGLRTRFYGRDTFDFSEQEFLALGQRLAEVRPDAALVLLAVHLEFNPQSSNTYVVMSRAHVRKRDTPAAIAALKKAIEVEPSNGLAQGYLYQLEPRR
ncbi:MAG: photosynthetic reaction center cytochrome c subunit family protein [Vicinamibacterales bacterium]